MVPRTIEFALFALEATGCTWLTALLITVSLSERLQPRDPVFNNFLYTWVLYSALATFDALVELSGQDHGDSAMVREYVLTTVTFVSTLNLSLHLWFLMRAGIQPSSPRSKKLRILTFVVTPYLFGLLPLPALFVPLWTDVATCFWIFMAIITPILDVILLNKFWRYKHMIQNTAIHGAVKISFLLKLFAFGVYRFLYTSLMVLMETESDVWIVAFKIAQNSFPLLAFFVMGLRTDVLRLWFPCLRTRKERVLDIEEPVTLVTAAHSNITVYDGMDDTQRLLDKGVTERQEELDPDIEPDMDHVP